SSNLPFVSQLAQPQGPQALPSRPVFDPDQVRRDAIEWFEANDNFSQQIDVMYDKSQGDEDFGLTRPEMHEGMAKYVEFLRNRNTLFVPDPNVIVAVNHLSKKFVYDPAKWSAVRKVGMHRLFHDAVHFAVKQQRDLKRILDLDEVLLPPPGVPLTPADKL